MMPDPTSFQGIGWLIVGLASLLVMLNQGLKLSDRFKPKDFVPPLHAQFAERAEFERYVQHNSEEHAALHSRIGGAERGLRQEIKTDIQAIHERINDVLKAVSRMEGKIS